MLFTVSHPLLCVLCVQHWRGGGRKKDEGGREGFLEEVTGTVKERPKLGSRDEMRKIAARRYKKEDGGGFRREEGWWHGRL